MTLYLKYRPQRISELNLSSVKQALGKVLASGKVPHAWLFSGSRGTGKTSSARILAKAINCETSDGFEPCNTCSMCVSITAGNAVDIMEIDAASNRGIDEIRELRDKVRLAPMKAKNKVYIIDEVHMLTTEAANALLKTLEEPPANTVFILCTTEPDRLPDTVVSRCSRVVFSKPTDEEMLESLKRVTDGEGVKYSPEALMAVARAAAGSFRDGIKILEQVISKGEDISEKTVLETIGATSDTDMEKFLEYLAARNTEQALKFIVDVDKQGGNFRRLTENLANRLRTELMAIVGRQKSIFNSKKQVVNLLAGLDKAYEQMKTSAVPQLPLEIWIIENTDTETQTPKMTGEINQKTKAAEAEPKQAVEEKPVRPEKIETETEPVSSNATGKGLYSLADVETKWNEIVKAVRPMNHSVEALLRSTKPTAFDGEKLEIEVFYKFHKDKLETEKCRSIVEDAVGGIFKVTGIKLFLKLGEKVKKSKEEVTAAGVGDDIVKAAEEIFGGPAI